VSSVVLCQRIGVVLCAAALAGCGTSVGDMNFFPNRGSIFKSQDWGSPGKTAPDLIPNGPVSPEEQVDAAGHCTAQAGATPAVEAPAAAAPAPAQQPTAVTPGGIALGMTECQVVARAGQASQVTIGAENNERKVVLTYPTGPSPGIYTFAAGRLKVIDRVAQPEPVKPARKKSRSKPASASIR
jgi:hypothetical protein